MTAVSEQTPRESSGRILRPNWRILTPDASPPLFEGALNVSILVPGQARDGRPVRVLRRYPKQNRHIFEALAYEYDGIGFTADGGRIRRRSRDEQHGFAKLAAEKGLRVLAPGINDRGLLETVFLDQAEKLDEYLPHATDRQVALVTRDIFADLYAAHRAGIIYGDRWAENILVSPVTGPVNIDFDIEISGPHAREFEAAQIATYILGGAKSRAVPQLAGILTHPYGRLDSRFTERYLRGHKRFYDADQKYGSIENEMESLISLMHMTNHGIRPL
jgi:hypothetical protein